MTNTMVDLNQDASTNLVSNTTRLTAPVDPVPDLNPSVEENKEAPRQCYHFTIRGYVLEVRKRDPTLCYPFTQQASTDLAKELPPMDIPKCGWCHCSGSVAEAAKDLHKDSHEIGHDAAQNINSADDPAQNISATIQNYEANPTDSNHNRYQLVSDINPDRKGKGKAHVEDELPLTSGFDDGVQNDVRAQWLLPQTKGSIDLNKSADNEVVYNGNGTPEALYKIYIVDHGEAGCSKGFGNPEKDHTAENHGGVPQTSSLGNQGADPPANGVVADIVGPDNHRKGFNLPDLNECSGEPCFEEIREIIVTETPIKSFCNGEPSSKETPIKSFCNGEPSSKETPIVTGTPIISFCNGEHSSEETPIVTETPINGEPSFEETPMVTETPINGDPSSEETPINRELSFEETPIVTETHIPINGFCKDDGASLGAERKKKRKVKLLSDLLGLKRGKGPYKGKKKTPSSASSKDENIMGLNEGSKKTVGTSIMSKSKGKSDSDDVSIEEIPMAVAKRRCKAVRDPLPEKRSKKTKVDNGDSTSLPQEVIIRRSLRNKGKATAETAPKRDLYDQLRLRNPVPTKKRGKNSMARKMVKEVRVIQENGNVVESPALRNPTVGRPSITGIHSDGRISTGPVSDSNEKRAEVPAAEERPHLAQSMPMQVTNNVVTQREHANEVRGLIHNVDINNIPIYDKACDQQGMGDDDIPMDIVELMAKNQYERHLDDPKVNNASLPSSSTYGRHNGAIYPFSGTYGRHNGASHPFSGTYGRHIGASHPSPGTYGRHNGASSSYAQPVLPSMHNPFLSMQNPPFTDPRSSMYEGYMGHFNPLGVHGLPQGSLLAARLLTPSRGEDLSHPYSIHAFTVGNWNMNNGLPPSFLQAVDKYQKERVTAPRHINAEAPRFWAPITTSRMAISGSILNSGISSLMQGNSAHPFYPSVVPTAHFYAAQYENDVGNLAKGIAEGQSSRPPVAPCDKGKAVASEPKPPNTNKAKRVSKGSSSKNTSSGPDNMICELNQNPSEFNDPQLNSQYIIGPEELKPPKKARDKASGSRGDARKPVARVSKPKPSGKGRKIQRS